MYSKQGIFAALFANFKDKLDQSALQRVEAAHGFNMHTAIEYRACNVWRQGVIAAIGEGAKRKIDGADFTAFLVAEEDGNIVLKTVDELRHLPEEGLPEKWVAALRAGWKILPCSCSCGCNFAWMKPLPSGAHIPFGCVSHHSPDV